MKLTPKEKAKILVEKNQEILSKHIFNGTYDIAIELSLLCVDEIQTFGNKAKINEPMMYWNTVRKELNKYKENFN